MKSTNTFSILFGQYAQRADVNNEAGLYDKIGLNGKKANISLKKKLNIKLWDSKTRHAGTLFQKSPIKSSTVI